MKDVLMIGITAILFVLCFYYWLAFYVNTRYDEAKTKFFFIISFFVPFLYTAVDFKKAMPEIIYRLKKIWKDLK